VREKKRKEKKRKEKKRKEKKRKKKKGARDLDPLEPNGRPSAGSRRKSLSLSLSPREKKERKKHKDPKKRTHQRRRAVGEQDMARRLLARRRDRLGKGGDRRGVVLGREGGVALGLLFFSFREMERVSSRSMHGA